MSFVFIFILADFLDTIDHYEMVSERRKDMTRLVYMLGDMLIAGEVEGDKEEWINHTEQVCCFVNEMLRPLKQISLEKLWEMKTLPRSSQHL